MPRKSKSRASNYFYLRFFLSFFFSLNNVYCSANTAHGNTKLHKCSTRHNCFRTLLNGQQDESKLTSSKGNSNRRWGNFDRLQGSIALSSPGRPKMRRLRSIDPTAIYFASGPNLTLVALPKTRQECKEHEGLIQSKRPQRPTTNNWQVSGREITCARHIRKSLYSVPI